MIASFMPFMPVLFRHEGGYANDPRDPGGETNYGISKRSYPAENIKGMTRARAEAIYKRDFWAKIGGDSLPAGVDVAVFDAAVNSGPRRAAEWLQEVVGVKRDGIIGPDTIRATKAANPRDVIERFSDRRLKFMKSSKDKNGRPLWPTYGKGWQRRVDDVRAVALGMVTDNRVVAVVDTPSVLSRLIDLIMGIFRK